MDVCDCLLFSISIAHCSNQLNLVQNARANSVSFCRQCRKLLTTPGLVDQLKGEKYDALITEAFDNCGVDKVSLLHVSILVSWVSLGSWDPGILSILASLALCYENSFSDL